MADGYQVGDKLALVKGKEGIVRFKGQLHDRDGLVYGVELTFGQGKHSGIYKDVQYFKCQKKMGLFVQDKHIVSKIIDPNDIKTKKKKKKKEQASKSKTKSKNKSKHISKSKSTEIYIDTNALYDRPKLKDKKSKSKTSTPKHTDSDYQNIDRSQNISPKKKPYKSKAHLFDSDDIEFESFPTNDSLKLKHSQSARLKKSKKEKKRFSEKDMQLPIRDSLKLKNSHSTKHTKHKKEKKDKKRKSETNKTESDLEDIENLKVIRENSEKEKRKRDKKDKKNKKRDSQTYNNTFDDNLAHAQYEDDNNLDIITEKEKRKKEKKDRKSKKRDSQIYNNTFDDDIVAAYEDDDSFIILSDKEKKKKDKKNKKRDSAKFTFDDDDLLALEEADTLRIISENSHKEKKKKEKKNKKRKKESSHKKKGSKILKGKTTLELAALAAWGSDEDEDEEQKEEEPAILPDPVDRLLTPKHRRSKSKSRKSKKNLVYTTPSIYIASKKKHKKYTKKVQTVDEIYLIQERFIHKRESLKITSKGKLLCNQWHPQTQKKGGIIRIQCDTEIIIDKEGVISASGRGWFGKYGHGMPQKLRHYDIFAGASYGSIGADYYDHNTKSEIKAGKMYGTRSLNTLFPGTGNKYLRGGGIIELVAPLIVNEGKIECNGGGGCSGGSIFICCDEFVNHGEITANGGKTTSFCGKGGVGRIAIYCNSYENRGSITPKHYRHQLLPAQDTKKAKKKKKKAKKKAEEEAVNKEDTKEEERKEEEEEKKEKTCYDEGLEIVSKREAIKMMVVYQEKKSAKFAFRGELKVDHVLMNKQRVCKQALDKIVNLLIKMDEKISNSKTEIYLPLNISKEVEATLGTEVGFEIMQKHRKLFIKTAFREHMVCDRLILELKFVKLLGSLQFMEFSVIEKATNDPFDSNTMATMRYTNGRMEPFNDILPRICWRLSYEYMSKFGKSDKTQKYKSDFKFREKSLESKICLFEFEGKLIQKYEILVKVDRSKDKYVSVLKNGSFADHKVVNIASFHMIETDDLRRCGFLRIEKFGKLYPKEWYSDTKEGGRVIIECIDCVCYGIIDVSKKGMYGKYGKGAGKMRKDKKKKKNAKRKVNKANENENYYFGASYTGKEKLSDLVFGCGITEKKHFKGGGVIDLYIKDHFINYGSIASDAALSASAGSIFICCKLFINYGVIQCLGGKEIQDKSGKGENGRIAIYCRVFENYGKILPQNNVYIGSFEEGIEIFKKRQKGK